MKEVKAATYTRRVPTIASLKVQNFYENLISMPVTNWLKPNVMKTNPSLKLTLCLKSSSDSP